MIRNFFIIILIIFVKACTGFAQCEISDTLIKIPDNEYPYGVKFIVEGVSNNDLSNPDQGVCRVHLKYEHFQRTELTIDLISPSGQTVRLIGPYNPFSSPNPGKRRWDIDFYPCSDAVSPDPGKSDHFNNNDNWGFLSQYSGSYYPHDYCLESFDTGPVNGTWTFLVYDHEKIYTGNLLGYSIEFCDGSEQDCDPCTANPGFFDNDTLNYCINDPMKGTDIRHIYEGKKADSLNYNYKYFISKDGAFFAVSDTFDVNNFGLGEYRIWGFSYHKNDSLAIFNLFNSVNFNKFIDSVSYEGIPFCSRMMSLPLIIRIYNTNIIANIPVSICEGEKFSFQGNDIDKAGIYYFKSFNNSCDTTYFLNVSTVELNPLIIAPDTVLNCQDNGYVRLTGSGFTPGIGMSFMWLEYPGEDNLEIAVGQPGIYHFILNAGKCSDTASIVITADNDIPIVDYDVQQIDCCHKSGKISLNVTNVAVSDYVWEYNGSVLPDNTSQILSANAGNYTVTVISGSGCEAVLVVDLPVDTLKPEVTFDYNDLTCIQSSSEITLSTSSDLISVNWIETGETGNEITVDVADIYHVAFTASNCCSSIDSVEIKNFKDKPDIEITGNSLDCLYETADLSFLSADSIVFYKWTTPDNIELYTKTINVSQPGNYILDIINKYGCENVDSFNLTQDVVLPDIFIPDVPLLLSCGIDSVQLSFVTTSDILMVEWTGPGNWKSNEIKPFVKFKGTYYLKLTGVNHCTASDSVIVLHDNTIPQIIIKTDTISCTDKEINISIDYSGNYSFDWLDPENNKLSGPIINSSISGFYRLTVTDIDNNCESQFLIEAPVDTTPVSVSLHASSLLDCNNETVYLYLSDYSRVKSIRWYNSSFESYSDTASVIYPGKYYVDINPDNDCSLTDSIIVISGDYIDLTPDTLVLTCASPVQTIILPGVNPNYIFSWKGPDTITSDSSAPVFSIPGDYSVTVTNGNCTESTIITLIEDKTIPEIRIEYDSIIECDPDYAVITGIILSDNISGFTWEGPSFFTTKNLTNFVYNEGTYKFTVVGNNGCEDSLFAIIRLSQNYPSITLTGDTLTCNSSIHPLIIECKVDGSYTSLTWRGPDNEIYEQAKNIVYREGKYICEVMNDLGCKTVDSVYVVIDTLKPLAFFNKIDTLTCLNDTIDISMTVSSLNSTVKWLGPYGFNSISEDIKVDQGGNYYVQVLGENGCIFIDSVFVPVNRLKPYIFLSGQNITGNNSKVKIEMKTSADNWDLVWQWPDGSFSYEDSLRTILAGIYRITVTDTDNGCSNTDSILVSIDTMPPDIVTENYYLPCDSSKIKMHVYSNRIGTIFYWFGPDNFYSVGSTAFTNVPGKYYIFAEGTNGIINKDSIEVFDIPILPEFEAFGNEITCRDLKVPVIATGILDDESFYWEGPGGFNSDLREPVVSVPGFYTLFVKGKNGCEDSLTVEVKVDTIKPEFTIFYSDSLVCENNKTTLHADDESDDRIFSYLWQTYDGTIDYGKYSSDPVVIGKGTYHVKVTDIKNGCSAIDSIIVTSSAYELDSIRFTVIEPSCYGYSDGSISIDSVFGGTGPYKYSTDNFYFSNIDLFNSKKAGSYRFYVKDKNGCKTDSLLLVGDGGDVQVSLGTDKEEIYSGSGVRIEAIVYAQNGIRTLNWDPKGLFTDKDSLSATIFPKESTLISLEVIDSNGCKSDDAIWINVLSKPDVYVPNIFTPDGDGNNDYFYIKTNNGVRSVREFKIFDRWGELLYQKNNLRLNVPVDGWDGKFNGSVVQNGVYVCYCRLELENGLFESFYTDLTLIK
jgi:gliding motility-associated-like protein